MKKILLFIFAFIFCISGGAMLSSSLVTQAEDTTVDIDYNEIEIASTQDFISTFNSSTTYNNSNIKIVLTSDLDFSDADLSSLYQTRRTFTGFFEGNGYTISNITLSSDMYYYGLIPYASGATIQNLRIAGEVNFILSETNTYPLFMGIIVGYGENVTIKNCELYNTEVVISDDETDDEGSSTQAESYIYHSVNLQAYSNITFGGIIGQATSFTISGLANTRSLIENCVNYYDFNVIINKNSRIAIGGIVGSLTNGSMVLNCLNFGNITLTNTLQEQADNVSPQYLGGISGEIDGIATQITNTANGGEINFANNTSTIDAHRGAIVGYLNCPQVSTYYNVSFSYWTQSGLSYYGTGYSVVADNLSQVEVINRNFLLNSANFDTRELGFDFDQTWTMLNSEILLQNFQDYTYTFNANLDVGQIISSATFSDNSGASSNTTLTAKYGNEITINITYQDIYIGYYRLSNVMLNGITLNDSYFTASPTTNTSGSISGYNITLFSSDATDGTYSFTLSAIPYNCVAEISEEALEGSQGRVRVVGADNQDGESSIDLPFSDTNRNISIQAVGSGIYTFSFWELYYRDDNGDFTIQATMSETLSQSQILNIEFGMLPFDREFRLVAYFTDEEAIGISFDGFDNTFIKSISVSGILYQGEPIDVSPTSSSVMIELTTNAGYQLNVDSFVEYIAALYGDFSTDTLITTEPTVANDETTYQFRLNMRYLQDSITDNSLIISLIVEEGGSGGEDSLLWVYIVVPIVAVIIIGVVVFFIVRNRRGGGGKIKTAKETKKEDNYKDYYI